MTLSKSDVSEEISELISEVGERYGIGSLITARRLTGGYANDVFRLDADGPPTVLHLKHPPVDADSLNCEHRLLAKLNKHLPEALAPVQALDGSTWFWFHARPVWLTPGRPATVLARTTGTLLPRCWAVRTRLRSSRPPDQTMPGCYSSRCRHCAESQRPSQRGAPSSPRPAPT